MRTFKYLLERIQATRLSSSPFRHLFIRNFFSETDLARIVVAPEINVHGATNDEELFGLLQDSGYDIIEFPGCITDASGYITWRAQRHKDPAIHTACEGFGVTLRLKQPRSSFIQELSEFISSATFAGFLAEKFDVRFSETRTDAGIQKYLDGYEISPHPDIRQKALTWMVNINPNPRAHELSHHTHYLRFKREYRYVQQYWEQHPEEDRCWVPWNWCESVFTQAENNSMVVFAPGDNTLHGVKAVYDHLLGQRTQIYGNLWNVHVVDRPKPEWEALERLDQRTAAG